MEIAADVECVWPARAVLGEGPCWDARSGAVYWVDIKGARLHAFDIATGAKRTWAPPHRIFSLGTPPPQWNPPAQAAHWFVGCAEPGFGWIGVAGDEILFQTLSHPEPGQTHNRFNDGKTGPDGRYWAGTMHDAESEPTGSLYAFAQDGAAARIDSGYVVSNGPAFSPDARTLYHTDSARRIIYAFDLDAAGQAARRRALIEFGEDDGYPDGMTCDRAGDLWVAMWDGGRIEKLSPEGRRLGALPIPARRPTSCVFVNDACTDLFVTSAAIGAPADDALAGALFRARLR